MHRLLLGACARFDSWANIAASLTHRPDSGSTQRFSWLHIVGLDRIGVEHWRNIREALLRDLERLQDRTGPCDAVLCAGELTATPGSTANGLVQQRLDELLAEPALAARPAVVWLPGRGEITPRRTPEARAARIWDTERELRDVDFWAPDSPYLRDVGAAHASFDTSHHRGSAEIRCGLLPGDAAWCWRVGERKIGLVALNSLFLAWAQPDGEGTIHARQFLAVCGGDLGVLSRGHDVSLLLTCHAREGLRPDARVCLDEFTPPGRFAVHLCSGAGTSITQKIAGASARRVVQAPSIGDDVDVRGYVIGSLTFAGDRADIRFWPRRLHITPNGWRFTPDDRWTLEDTGSTTPEPIETRSSRVAQVVPRELGSALRAEGVAIAEGTTVLGEVRADRTVLAWPAVLSPSITGSVISPCFADARLGLRAVHGHQGGSWHMGGSLEELVDKLCGPADSILAWDGRVLAPGALIELALQLHGVRGEDPWLAALEQAVAGATSGTSRGVLVLGAPGAGKTVWSQRIVGSTRCGLLGALGVAVRRSARELSEDLREPGERSWAALAARREPGRAALFAALGRTGRLIPVVDGLDEINAADLAQIEVLLRGCPGVWIATGRPEMSVRLSEAMVAATLHIEKFTPTLREALLRGMGRPDLAARTDSRRSRHGDENDTPLFAALEARVVRPGEHAEAIHPEDLHRRLFAELLAQAEREQRLTAASAQLLHALLGDVVGKLALRWLRDSSRPLERGDIDLALTASGLGLPDRVHALRALEFGHLLRPVDGGWEFAHRTLAEWACAEHLRLHLQREAPAGGDRELAVLGPLLAEAGSRSRGRWAQVLRFLAPHLDPLALFGVLVGPGSHLHWCEVRAHKDPDRHIREHEAVGTLQAELRFAGELLARQRWPSPSLARRCWAGLARLHLWLRGREGASTDSFPREHLAPYSSAVPPELDEVIALVGATADIRAELQADPTLLLALLPDGCDATIAAILDRCTQPQQTTVLRWCEDGRAQLHPSWLDAQIQRLAQRRSATNHGLDPDERSFESALWDIAIRTGRVPAWDLVRRCAETWPGHLTGALLAWFARDPRSSWGDRTNERRVFLGIVLHRTVEEWTVLAEGLRFHAAGSSRYLEVLSRAAIVLRQNEEHSAERQFLRWCAEAGAPDRWTGTSDEQVRAAASVLADHVGVVRGWQGRLQSLLERLDPAAFEMIAGGLLVGSGPGSAAQEQLRLAFAAARHWPVVVPVDEILRCCEAMSRYELRGVKLGPQHLLDLRLLAARQTGATRIRTLEILAGIEDADPTERLLTALADADEAFVIHALEALAHGAPPRVLPAVPVALQRRLPLAFQAAYSLPGWHVALLRAIEADEPGLDMHLSLAAEHHVAAALPRIVERLERAPAGARFPAAQALRAVAQLTTPNDHELAARALRAALRRGWSVEASRFPGDPPSLWRFLALEDVELLAGAGISALEQRELAPYLLALGAPAYTRLLASYRRCHAGQDAWTRARETALENLFALVIPGETPLIDVVELCDEVPADSYTLSHSPGPLGAEFDEPEDQEWFSSHDAERLIGAAKEKLAACVHACPAEWAHLRRLLHHPSSKLRAEAFARLVEVAPWDVLREDALGLLLTAIRAPAPVITGDPRGVALLAEGRAEGPAELPDAWRDSLQIVEGCLGVQHHFFIASLLASERPMLRLQGARWAGKFGLASWCEMLAPLLAEPRASIVLAALEAMARLDPGAAAKRVEKADRRAWNTAHYFALLSRTLAPKFNWQDTSWRSVALPADLLPRLLDEAAQVEPLPASEARAGVFFGFPTLAESIIEHIAAHTLPSWRAWTEHANPRVRAVGRRLLAERSAIGVDELMPLLASHDIADQQSAAECLTRLQAEDIRPALMQRWETWLPRDRRWDATMRVPRALEAAALRLLWALRGVSPAWFPLLGLPLADIPIDSEDYTPTPAGEQRCDLGAAVLQTLDLDGVVALVAAMDRGEVTVDSYFEDYIVQRAFAEPGIREQLGAQPPGPLACTILTELTNRETDGRVQLQRHLLREVAFP